MNKELQDDQNIIEKSANCIILDTETKYSDELFVQYLKTGENNRQVIHWLNIQPGLDHLAFASDDLLHEALKVQNEEIAIWLSERKIGILTSNEFDQIPLHVAAQLDLTGALESLLENTPSEYVESPDDQGIPPAYYAITNGSIQAVSLFINYQVNLLSCIIDPFYTKAPDNLDRLFELDEDQYNPEKDVIISHPHPLTYCYETDNVELFKILTTAENQLCEDEKRNSPLHHAALFGAYKITNYLIEKIKDLNPNLVIPNINKRNSSGETPIFLAVRSEKIECIDLLFKNGADVSITNREDLSAIALIEHKIKFRKPDEKSALQIFIEALIALFKLDNPKLDTPKIDSPKVNTLIPSPAPASLECERNKSIHWGRDRTTSGASASSTPPADKICFGFVIVNPTPTQTTPRSSRGFKPI